MRNLALEQRRGVRSVGRECPFRNRGIVFSDRMAPILMDPRFFPNQEARLETVALIEKSTTTLVYYSITNGPAFGHFKGTNSVHCFVPYVSDAKVRGQRATVKSYLLATRYNGSNEWFFMDIGTRDREYLARYYEHLPDELPKASLEKKE